LQAGASANQLYLGTNGSVGIGDGTPTEAKLVVRGNAGNNITLSGQYTNYTYAAIAGPATTPAINYSASIYADGVICTSSNVVASALQALQNITPSDRRIKDIIGVSNTSKDLDTLEKIKVTDYTLKDKHLIGGQVIKKVIAQEVEEVFPNAISVTTGYLPDIMKVSKAVSKGNGVFEINLEKSPNLKVGDQIKVLNNKDQTEFPVVKSVEDNTFTVSLSLVGDAEDVFVYGRQVNDFRTVDYDAISMLNVSATQELSKEIKALKAENAELKKLASEMKELKALVAALEGKSNETVTVSLVK